MMLWERALLWWLAGQNPFLAAGGGPHGQGASTEGKGQAEVFTMWAPWVLCLLPKVYCPDLIVPGVLPLPILRITPGGRIDCVRLEFCGDLLF